MTCTKSIYDSIFILLNQYLHGRYTEKQCTTLISEIKKLSSNFFYLEEQNEKIEYEYLDNQLSIINEKQAIRKSNGVYYTEKDITEFIIDECVSHSTGNINFITNSVFDPTCGSGEFLLSALKIKCLYNNQVIVNYKIKDVVATIFGNDLDPDSIFITKLRILFFLLDTYGVASIKGVAKILNNNFTCSNFLDFKSKRKFDYIIGNPPYVEDKKISKYGNLYADVLDNVSNLSSEDGIIGFIIPLSYVATPRMAKIRDKINSVYSLQYIYNYSDRPACLFTQVHQKLTILIAKKDVIKKTYTGNYQYWYKNDRKKLFMQQTNIENPFQTKEFIPKIGTFEDKSIYEKISKYDQCINSFILDSKKCDINGKPFVSLNMRAAFWIKAFLNEHTGKEYKAIYCQNDDERNYLYCLLNSSLFWWYWICVSDCWHITNKEFDNFKFPNNFDSPRVGVLAFNLENKLEETKNYIGSKQTDYEYKHKFCLSEINAIDDYVNSLFGLTDKESNYIKNYALLYRTSGGNQN